MEPDLIGDQADQNNSAEVRLPSRANQADRAVYRLDPLTSGMELRPDPRPDIRTARAGTHSSQPSRQAKANSRARLDLDRELSQNDRDFSLLVSHVNQCKRANEEHKPDDETGSLAQTKCPKDQTDGLSLMFDTLLDIYHSYFSKARIIKLSEDLGRISALLDHPADCPDCPMFVQPLTATEPSWPD